VPHHVLEKRDRAFLIAAKVVLMAAAIAAFLPAIFRAALRHLSRYATRKGPVR
jgi:hypothetical protein